MKWQTEKAAFAQLLLSGTLVCEATFEDLRERLDYLVTL